MTSMVHGRCSAPQRAATAAAARRCPAGRLMRESGGMEESLRSRDSRSRGDARRRRRRRPPPKEAPWASEDSEPAPVPPRPSRGPRLLDSDGPPASTDTDPPQPPKGSGGFGARVCPAPAVAAARLRLATAAAVVRPRGVYGARLGRDSEGSRRRRRRRRGRRQRGGAGRIGRRWGSGGDCVRGVRGRANTGPSSRRGLAAAEPAAANLIRGRRTRRGG